MGGGEGELDCTLVTMADEGGEAERGERSGWQKPLRARKKVRSVLREGGRKGEFEQYISGRERDGVLVCACTT